MIRTCVCSGCFRRPTGDLRLQLIRRTDHVEAMAPPMFSCLRSVARLPWRCPHATLRRAPATPPPAVLTNPEVRDADSDRRRRDDCQARPARRARTRRARSARSPRRRRGCRARRRVAPRPRDSRREDARSRRGRGRPPHQRGRPTPDRPPDRVRRRGDDRARRRRRRLRLPDQAVPRVGDRARDRDGLGAPHRLADHTPRARPEADPRDGDGRRRRRRHAPLPVAHRAARRRTRRRQPDGRRSAESCTRTEPRELGSRESTATVTIRLS